METIDMQELEQELRTTRAAYKQWAGLTTQAAKQARSAHCERLMAAKEDVIALQQAYVASRGVKHAGAAIEQLQPNAPMQAPAVEQAQLQQALDEMQHQLQAQAAQQEQEQADLAVKQEDQDHSLRSLRKLLQAYERCLGLRMEPGKDHLKIVFTQISEAAPEEPYMFAVQVQEGADYSVVLCEPEVPGWQSLAQEMLQQRQDLAGFVAAMRRKFKELAAATDGVAALTLQQRRRRRS